MKIVRKYRVWRAEMDEIYAAMKLNAAKARLNKLIGLRTSSSPALICQLRQHARAAISAAQHELDAAQAKRKSLTT
jgi:type VI protein secretion system component VasF